jgi:hypothetical protein
MLNGSIQLGRSPDGLLEPVGPFAPRFAAGSRDTVGRGLAQARPRLNWLDLLCLTLLGYALFGKGWAYVGIPPLFIGDAVLLLGVLRLLLLTRGWTEILRSPPLWVLLVLMAWGLLRTVPYFPRYRLDALRDAVIWGYGIFVPLVFAVVVTRPERLALLVRRYSLFTRIFVTAVPVVWIALRFRGDAIPRWPWADVPVIHAKGGDLLVHLAGVLAFWAAGLGRVRPWWVLLLACNVALIGAYNRAGLMSFLMVFGLCGVFRPLAGALWRVAGVVVCGLLVLALTGARLQMSGKGREVSFEQLSDNVLSVVGGSEEEDLDGTKQWRLKWWGDIVNYTVNGEHFWTGKGFGINLADDDGYQGTAWEGQLRSPHNGHMTMLARAGVPGLALWLLLHLAWGAEVLYAYFRASAAGSRQWQALFLFLLLYWAAFMANTSFDVFIEGPMGGIWFWTIYGVGLAAVWTYRHYPQVLRDDLGDAAVELTRR